MAVGYVIIKEHGVDSKPDNTETADLIDERQSRWGAGTPKFDIASKRNRTHPLQYQWKGRTPNAGKFKKRNSDEMS